MNDTAWLVLALMAGVLVAAGWVARERAIHRRRRRAALEGDEK